MKALILTSSLHGTAAHHLPLLLEDGCCEVVMVIYNRSLTKDKKRYYRKKLKKAFSIGLLGALNGIRMRKWYNENIKKYVEIEDLEQIYIRNRIPLYKVDRANSEETAELFRRSSADVGISLGNGFISKKIFSIPKFGMINIHHESLPQYQNAQSVIWQLYNHSTQTGFTIHKIDDKIDTGDILYQESVPIAFESSLAETVAKTSAHLLAASGKGLVRVLRDFETYYEKATPQGPGKKYTTPSIYQFIKIYFSHRKHRNNA